MSFDFEVDVKGATEVERALDKLPADVQAAVAKEKRKLAQKLATKLRAAGRGATKPRGTGGASSTVRASGDGVTAGPHPLLFVSEFGSRARYGWYGDERYKDSAGRQYRPYVGSAGYWWAPTIEREKPLYDEACQKILDDALNKWSA